MKLSKFVISALEQEGARHVFMIPGGFVDNFVPDMVSTQNIVPIVAASESGAAMMADGYARASEGFGVCLGIGGPGATNMITGLSMSLADQVPVLAIIGETPTAWRDRDAIQDSGAQGLDTLSLMRGCVKEQYQVFEPKLIGDYVRRSVDGLRGSQKGPVMLSVAMDRQSLEVDESYAPRSPLRHEHRPVDLEAAHQALELIAQNKRCVVLAGSGINQAEANAMLVQFAEKHHLPVATTIAAKGAFPENHPLSLGVSGWAGTGWANELLINDKIDCLFVIGSRLGQIDSFSWSKKLVQDRRVIQLDICADHLSRTFAADIEILGDARATLSTMLEDDNTSEPLLAFRAQWLNSIKEQYPYHYQSENYNSYCEPIHPARAIRRLHRQADENSILITDNGAHTFFATHYWQSNQPRSFFNAIKYSGAMGWGIPAAIGIAFANPDRQVISVVGDGCMLMEGIELQTAARYGLNNLTIVVMNNRAHGNPKIRAEGLDEEAVKITDIVDHNWAQFAESLGARGLSVSEPELLDQVYAEAFSTPNAVLIDVKCGNYPTPTKVFDETFMEDFYQYSDCRPGDEEDDPSRPAL